jgi:hypothetical protein
MSLLPSRFFRISSTITKLTNPTKPRRASPAAESTECAVFTPLQSFRKAADKHIMDVMNAALGGMMIAQSSFDRTAQTIAGASTQSPRSAQPPDSVDLSTEAVNLLATRNQFQASVQVFQAGDKMQKKLLDIMA